MEDMEKESFQFHHAEGQIAHLFLWLNGEVNNKIPAYGTHQVGVGAVVVNSRNEILCVRELRKNYLKWKIPSGLAEIGENLDDAAIREVKEETMINCVFCSVLAFRHTHGVQFNRSDLFFVCQLRPIEDSGMIPEPVAQEDEIAVASWIPLDEYRNMVESGHPMMRQVMNLYDQQADIQMTMCESVVPGRKPSPIYHTPLENSVK